MYRQRNTKYHTFWRRAGAFVIDSLVLSPLSLAPLVGVALFGDISANAYIIMTSITMAVSMAYFIILPAQRGQTLGKKALGLQIVCVDDYSISYKEAALRYVPLLVLSLVMAVPVFIWISGLGKIDMVSLRSMPRWIKAVNEGWLFVQVIVTLSNPQRRAVHDYLAGTKVIVL